MKSIVIATLLITLVFASLRGAERKEREHQNKNDYSDSQASGYSYDSESDSDSYGSYSGSGYSYSDSDSDSDSLDYSGYSGYSDDSDYSDNSEEFSSYSYDSEEKVEHPRPPKDEFPRLVFKTLRKIERGILEEWRLAEDPSLKNDIRSLLIQNLENLLPIAEEPVDPVESQNSSPRPPKPDDHHPKPPQPEEDEFAKQVFEQLHQIGSIILDQWNVEQNIEVKNQIRADLIQQLSVLIPEGTIIIDAPTEIEVGN